MVTCLDIYMLWFGCHKQTWNIHLVNTRIIMVTNVAAMT